MTSHPKRIAGTFDIKPTTAPAGDRPDELMINWCTLPPGSMAKIYLPGVSAADIRTQAGALYGYQPFTLIDAHTLGCPARGISYLPIPRAPGNLAGLLDVMLPDDAAVGDRLVVTVSQLSTQTANVAIDRAAVAFSGASRQLAWRKVTGKFQLALKVAETASARPVVERNLSILRWIFAAIPPASRWYPVMQTYLAALADQVTGLGGDPSQIPASATGTWPGGPSPGGAASAASGCVKWLLLLLGLLLMLGAVLGWLLWNLPTAIAAAMFILGAILEILGFLKTV